MLVSAICKRSWNNLFPLYRNVADFSTFLAHFDSFFLLIIKIMRQKSAFRLTLTRNTLYNRFRRRKNGVIFLGEWLNGRVVVSKTIGCVWRESDSMRLDKLITSLFRRSLWLLLTNRAPHQKTDYSVLFVLQGNGRVFDRQAQVPCAVACDAKVTLCK